MRITLLVFTLIFAVMVLLQRNDPDPLLWMGFYGTMAAVSLLGMVRKVPVLLLAVVSCWAGWLASDAYRGFVRFMNDESLSVGDTMSDSKPYIEEAREFGGLCIAGIALLIILLPIRSRSSSKSSKK